MRAFVGIDLDTAWRTSLGEACDAIRAAEPGWDEQKWVPRENLHLTLKFLGDISSDSVPEFADELRIALADTAAFALPVSRLFDGIPDPRRAMMIWTTLLDPEGRCAALAETVDGVADMFGVLPDTREFTPHITLCRARRPRALRTAESAEEYSRGQLTTPGGDLLMSVGAVTFFTSTLTEKRPFYEKVAVIPLG